MWGIATQAGVGVAITGITATYYALTARNLRLERERIARGERGERGEGDAPDVLKIEGENDLSSSNRLLKKELQEISSSANGSVSGLNVLYQQHPLNQFPPSEFALTPVSSSVSDSQSEEELREIGSTDFDTEEVNNEIDEATREYLKMAGSVEESQAVGSSEMPEEEEDEDSQNSQMEKDNSRESIGEKWKAVQETGVADRKKSPVCYFKNPDFGNKYAIKHEENSIVRQASQIELAEADKGHPITRQVSQLEFPEWNGEGIEGEIAYADLDVQSTPSVTDDYKESAQFILSPVKSEAVSIMEEETTDKVLQCDEKRIHEDDFDNRSVTMKAEALERAESSVYQVNKKRVITNIKRKTIVNKSKTGSRIRFRADPDIRNLGPLLKRTAKPIISPTVVESIPSVIKCENKPVSKTSSFYDEELPEKVDENNNHWGFDNLSESEDEGVFEEPNLLPSKIASRVKLAMKPEDLDVAQDPSFKTLSGRVFNRTMKTMPWRVVAVCILVVVVAGFLIMLFTPLAKALEARFDNKKLM